MIEIDEACAEPTVTSDASRVDEPVTLVPHDPAWAGIFAREQARVGAALGVASEVIVHVGSTAVPGLVAKPVVDLMLGVAAWPPPADSTRRLEALGYEALGEAGVPERLYFRLRTPPARNLHLVVRGGSHWDANLRLRDHLRTDPVAAARYAAAKQAALASGPARLLAYSDAKAPVLIELLREAGVETARRDERAAANRSTR